MSFKRVILIILDGVGIGEAPDAPEYGDQGSNTLLHIHQKIGLSVPHMARLGLSNLLPLQEKSSTGAWGIMQEKSKGKDTTTGHWEIAGVILPKPFPTYPQGFPPEIINLFCQEINRGVLGNYPASGTEIIEKLGEEHLQTGKPIVYTSADSVLQIATHEDIIPISELYEMCTKARKILTGKHAVGRVIARPFIGAVGSFERTSRRKDFSLKPLEETILDHLKKSGREAIGIGKISDIFAAQGITASYPSKGNAACMQSLFECLEKDFEGLVFVNLIDFDMHYGHRNNPKGFAEALETFDSQIPDLLASIREDDLLLITADHGNDPTTASTDHSREYVPLLAYHKNMRTSIDLGIRKTFADIAQTIDNNFMLKKVATGSSFLEKL